MASDQTYDGAASKQFWLPSRRLTNTLGFLACVTMMIFGFFLQHVIGLEPCPLCTLQRGAIIVLGLCFAVAAIHDPKPLGARIYGIILLLVAGSGAAISARHVYLQNLPADQVPVCGPDLATMMQMFSLSETLIQVLRGSGDCADVLWRFMGLSIPAWTFICLVLLGLVGIIRNSLSR